MGFDIDQLITQMIDGLAKDTKEKGGNPTFQIHAKDCAECRDRLMILMEKTMNAAFQQQFFIEGLREFAARVEQHSKETL